MSVMLIIGLAFVAVVGLAMWRTRGPAVSQPRVPDYIDGTEFMLVEQIRRMSDEDQQQHHDPGPDHFIGDGHDHGGHFVGDGHDHGGDAGHD